MPTVTEALSQLFKTYAEAKKVNNPDILRRYKDSMEVQVNVAVAKGRPVEGLRNTYESKGTQFHPFRIPKKAGTPEAYFKDYPLSWSLEEYANAIGMTGWDWKFKRSKFIAFDFDSITNHTKGTGLTDEELQKIKQAVWDIPWIEIRASTRGNGIHLYVYFCDIDADDHAGIATETHIEHAALARSILSIMDQKANCDFASAVDVCGGNIWVWHTDAIDNPKSFIVLKKATENFTGDLLPNNWLDHTEVVTKKRHKIRVNGLSSNDEDSFNNLANSNQNAPLTRFHEAVLNDLYNSGYTTIWNQDYHVVQTHTCAFKKIIEENPGKYKGFFETISGGTDPGSFNCFAFPLPDRGFRVFRFGTNTKEHSFWKRGDTSWTFTYFDCLPSFDEIARAIEGFDLAKGGFQFESGQKVQEALKLMGCKLDIDLDIYTDREFQLKQDENGRIVIRMRFKKGDSSPGSGWANQIRWWEKVIRDTNVRQEVENQDFEKCDSIVRSVKVSGDSAGFFACDDNNEWVRQPLANLKCFLKGRNIPPTEVDAVIGNSIHKSWKLVNIPFHPEYPGGRTWNKDAAQWKYKPVDLEFDEAPHHPYWDMILTHVGKDLDPILKIHPWAIKHGIKTGRDYLLLWIASLFRHPFDKLPYLFLYGPENSGKSIVHSGLERLMTKGFCRAERALTNKSEFNGELVGAILAVIEEKNIVSDTTRERMKALVTEDYTPIRQMRMDVYLQKNTLHIIQCANYIQYCLAAFGDTRITMINVLPFSKGTEVPETLLKQYLEDEAPHFMRTIIDLPIPEPEGRLRIPQIQTFKKTQFEESTLDDLNMFIEEACHWFPGRALEWMEFYRLFLQWLPDDEKDSWASKKAMKILPERFPLGKVGEKNQLHIGNISIGESPSPEDLKNEILIRKKGKLILLSDAGAP